MTVEESQATAKIKFKREEQKQTLVRHKKKDPELKKHGKINIALIKIQSRSTLEKTTRDEVPRNVVIVFGMLGSTQ